MSALFIWPDNKVNPISYNTLNVKVKMEGSVHQFYCLCQTNQTKYGDVIPLLSLLNLLNYKNIVQFIQIGYSILWLTTKCHMPTINLDAVKRQELPSFVLKEQNTSMPSMERKKTYLSLVFIINQQTMYTFIGHYNI